MATLNRLADPASAGGPGGGGAWSGNYLAVTHETAPYLAFYRLDGNVLTKLANPTAPAGMAYHCAWSGDYLAVAHENSPRVSFYRRDGEVLTKLANPTALSGTGYHCAWSGDYLTVAFEASPYLGFYRRDGNVLTKLTSPTVAAGGIYASAWTGDYLAVATDASPYLLFYRRDANALTKLTNPSALEDMALFCAWSGDVLAVVQLGGTGVALYRKEAETLTRLADPAMSIGGIGALAWNGNYLVVNHSYPGISFHELAGDVLTELTAPTSPGMATYGSAWNGDYLAMAGGASPFVTLYHLNAAAGVEFVFFAAMESVGSVGELQHLTGSIHMETTLEGVASALILWNDWTPGVNPYRDAKIYQIRLEKTGFAPLILPVTNISVRATAEGRQSSITCTIPDLAQVDAIAERASGGQLIFAGGYVLAGVPRLNDILRLPLKDIRSDEGTTNKSLTLTATGPRPTAVAKSVTIGAIEYQSLNGLKRLLRLPVDVNLAPGDSIHTGTATWTVGEVVYALGEGGESMTVTEA